MGVFDADIPTRQRKMMGHLSYWSREKAERDAALAAASKAHRVANARERVAAKIVMALVDQIVADIVRPGPHPEERECYEMAGELRSIVPSLEAVAKQILDVENGVE